MAQYEYIRIKDLPEPLFDSLEQIANKWGLDGWRVIHIDTTCYPKTATLERVKPVDSRTKK